MIFSKALNKFHICINLDIRADTFFINEVIVGELDERQSSASLTVVSPIFKIGYIQNKKSVLSSGFPFSRDLKHISNFGECVTEAVSIFDVDVQSLTIDILKDLGFSENKRIIV